LTQVITGTFLKTYAGTADQTLPGLVQALTGTFSPPVFTGTIDQQLPRIVQAGTGTFSPGTSTGFVAQQLPGLISQATGSFAAGSSTGSISQTLPSLIQILTGTFSAGISTGSIDQTLPALTQALTGTFLALHTGNLFRNDRSNFTGFDPVFIGYFFKDLHCINRSNIAFPDSGNDRHVYVTYIYRNHRPDITKFEFCLIRYFLGRIQNCNYLTNSTEFSFSINRHFRAW
jgi:hypothetical protein